MGSWTALKASLVYVVAPTPDQARDEHLGCVVVFSMLRIGLGLRGEVRLGFGLGLGLALGLGLGLGFGLGLGLGLRGG